MNQAVDYIIVGAGSAGCVLANRLSENGKHSVCLLEAGPPDSNLWIHIPIGYGRTMFDKHVNWGFYTDPEPNMLGRRIYWPRGKTLGGSSSINGLIYIRGQRQDYDHWAELGNPGWGWDDCLPYFRKLEHNDLGPGPTRGTDGPLYASSIRARHELVEAFIQSAEANGIPRTDDFNTGDQEGVGYYQLTTHGGWRCSSAVRAGLADGVTRRTPFVGRDGEALDGFANGKGRVFVDGKDWAAETEEPIPAISQEVVVIGLDGAVLKVRKIPT